MDDFNWLGFSGGLAFGTATWLLLRKLVLPLLHRWLMRRHVAKTALPRGTRPSVLMHYDGVTYDLTDSLLRAKDDPDGWVVWVVHGPQHLRLIHPPTMEIRLPLPRQTHVRLTMQGSPDDSRFSTLDEIRKEFELFTT